jgi:hypothetical protein
MPVTDDQVATLRALLSDDMDRYRRLFAGLERGEAAKGYSALIAAGFSEAALRRFGSDYTQADIITFVASLRARSENVSQALDPDAAELLLNATLGDASTRGMSREVKVNTEISLLVGLIADEHLDHAGLDAFLADARKLADQIMGG